MKTFLPKEKDFDKKTHLINADGKTLGRLATRVASLLIGKGKPTFCYDQIAGDQVIVTNAAKIHVTGKKRTDKEYKHYTGYTDGLKIYTFEKLHERRPEEIIRRAVARMLPKNHLGRKMLKQLRVYAGAEHKQQAQKPVEMEV